MLSSASLVIAALSLAVDTTSAFDGFTSVQVGTDVCFYISHTPRYPYQDATAFTNGFHAAKQSCEQIGLQLAVLETEDEFKAIVNTANCMMSGVLGAGTLLTIDDHDDALRSPVTAYRTGNTTVNHKCVFIDYEEMTEYSTNDHAEGCLRDVSVSRPEPKFVCRKNKACRK